VHVHVYAQGAHHSLAHTHLALGSVCQANWVLPPPPAQRGQKATTHAHKAHQEGYQYDPQEHPEDNAGEA
jgi:hypothetical protein